MPTCITPCVSDLVGEAALLDPQVAFRLIQALTQQASYLLARLPLREVAAEAGDDIGCGQRLREKPAQGGPDRGIAPLTPSALTGRDLTGQLRVGVDIGSQELLLPVGDEA